MSTVKVGLLLVLLFGGLALLSAKEPSTSLLTLVSQFNGYFTNKQQKVMDKVNKDLKDEHDRIIAIWRPVQVAAFPGQCAIYLEQILNGKINRMTLLVLSEDDLEVIHAQPLNVVPPKGYRPTAYQYADLTYIKLESLTAPPECEVLFYRVEENIYVGSYPDCVSSPAPWPYADIKRIVRLEYYVDRWRRSGTENSKALDVIQFKMYPLPPCVTSAANFTVPCNFTYD